MIANHDICDAACSLVRDVIPAGKLRYAFIAGSRAAGHPRSHSDVDLFVVLNQPSRPDEIALADAMRQLHQDHGLEFSHCGAILSMATLENMLASVGQLRILIGRGFLNAACFQSDCILSMARKFLVVLHMLAGTKSNLLGDRAALDADSMCASEFFESERGFFVPRQAQALAWPCNLREDGLRARWEVFMRRIHAGELHHTPVGIGLERWFLDATFGSLALPPDGARDASFSFASDRCPLQDMPGDHQLFRIINAQCLGSSLGDAKGAEKR